jgi:hypothetical protein
MTLPPAPRMVSTGQISSGLLCSTSTTSPTERPWAWIALRMASGSRRVVKLQASTTTRSSKNQDPGAMRGPSISDARRRGVATTPVAKGATSYGTGASATGEGGLGQPLPPGVPARYSPRGGEPASPLPVETARSEHHLVQDPVGSGPWWSPGRRGSPRPASAPQCAGGL